MLGYVYIKKLYIPNNFALPPLLRLRNNQLPFDEKGGRLLHNCHALTKPENPY
jgi:hypothetical protein